MKKGFALLLSLLIISVVLASALSAFNLIRGEITLSSGTVASQVSFYAARSGIECARYWEFKHPNLSDSAFAVSTQSSIVNFCQGQSVPTVVVGGITGPNLFSLTFSNGSCVNVSAQKTGVGNKIHVNAQGQNTIPCSSQSSRTVQRGLDETY